MSADAPQPDLLDTARREFERAMARNIKGLGYFTSPAPVLGVSPKEVLIERGTMRLYHYRPLVDDVYRVPILLVMATTNRGYIFDMVPGQSLVEFLLLRGYDVFMLDWEAPRSEDRGLSLKDYLVLSMTPPDPAKTPFNELRQVVPVRLTTDSWSSDGACQTFSASDYSIPVLASGARQTANVSAPVYHPA